MDRRVCVGQSADCVVPGGTRVWTAGQVADPNDPSSFVWKITLSNGTFIEIPMVFETWGMNEPSLSEPHCAAFVGQNFVYELKSQLCYDYACYVCEIDL